MKNILITSVGRRVSLVNFFKKEAKLINEDIIIFTADANPLLSSACVDSGNYFKVPRLDDSNYSSFLKEKCIQNNIGLVIPTIDTELRLLADFRKDFAKSGIEVLVSDSSLIQKCRDKRETHKLFKKLGIDYAKEYSKDHLEYPLFIKPSDGSRSVDTFLINSVTELTDYHLGNDKFMFLEYLDHSEYIEYTCDLYYDKESTLKCVVPRKRIFVKDGEVNKAKTEKNLIVDFVESHLAKLDGARGCLTLQLFFNGTRIVGIEINPRFGGGYPLSYLAGANYPRWILSEYFLNKPIESYSDWENNLLMLRYESEVLLRGYEG